MAELSNLSKCCVFKKKAEENILTFYIPMFKKFETVFYLEIDGWFNTCHNIIFPSVAWCF